MHPNCHTIVNGLTGTLAAVTSFSVTLMEQVEIGLRISTSLLGLVIAAITLRNLLRSPKK